ncbi:type II toxin-antitoxin system prevent-host-death family antitoxin [Lentilactobacillus kisonensis]|uniref:Prevent-host-death family protein n=2 Tax=Lentilactobacillus kisonensis TaxID=481722 RepID=H1LBX4_9LACO|nr:type II toxin-antitoxin system prevent-host-death family antitoxin [Lentilactobacillus kisonensis]EHO54524.1 prevent-host-death family protein [Lentilactobacillus kisonensis F0435]KRL23012.1 prevent-host-death family protein [Lentilactobacillus kisonensis DSM 19906 = JCM 15041]
MKIPNSRIKNIKPISELRSYNKLLDEVTPENPVILTKNGYGKYAIIDIAEYEKYERTQMADELAQIQFVNDARKGDLHSLEDVKREIINR